MVLMRTPSTAVAFSIFGHEIRWYGILMALGVILAVILGAHEVKRKKMYRETMYDLCLWAIPLGIIGARLYYVLFELDYYISNPVSILYIWEGGLAIYGAVIGGMIGIMIYSLRKKVRFLKLADIVAPGLVLAQAIGRWGNFFNQEAYGPLVTNEAHKWFPLAVQLDSGAIHYATFFYESMWCLLIFLVLWFFVRKRQKHDGDMILTYAMLYAFERMLVEQLRQDSLMLGSLRISQVLSGLIFIAVLVFFIVRAIREKKEGRLMWPAPETEETEEKEETEPACEDEGAETEQENGAESEDGTVYDNGEANE